MASSTFGSSGMDENKSQVVGGEANTSGPGPEIMAADTLEGDDVVNTKGEDLGNIKDIMIDVPSGRVAYAVLSSGGFLGIGDKLFAIPWSALTLDADRKCFILDVDKETLKNAPGFDKDHWPSMADPTWAQEVHDYYGQRGYWTGSSGTMGTGSSLGSTGGPTVGSSTGAGLGTRSGSTGSSSLGGTGRTTIGPEDI
jgi:sporulation protein YlmC with PRC-barrel domain